MFVADYVLMGYGTGAIMAVPGQDQRDWDFAEAYGLPIIRTVEPPAGWEGQAYTGDGPAINSYNDEISLDGLGVAEAKRAITDWLVGKGTGEAVVQYKLRDWLFSRQRYWGEPFPIVWDEHGPVALPDDQLPVVLPEIDDYSPKTYAPDAADTEPEPPLSRAPDWVNVELDLGDGPKTYRRETNTMPQWAGSCWYYLRYLDPHDDKYFCAPEIEQYWMAADPARPGDPGGVDLYVGGVEHAVLHLLYARFWHKVLHDLGEVSSEEPFRRLFNQGYIQAYAYTDARGTYVPAEEVVESPGGGFTWNNAPVSQEYGKMGKSLRNVVTPDEICERYGADTFRLYEMSTGPMDVSRPWSTRDVVGSQRFLQRVWRNLVDETTGASRVTRRRAGRRDAAAAAPHHRRGARGPAGAALQHRRRQADRAEQPPDQARRRRAAVGRRAVGADAGPAGSARRRGAVGPAGTRRLAGARPVPGGRRAVAGRRDGRVPDPGQRQGPLTGHRAGRRGPGRRAGGGAGRREDRRGAGRPGAAEGDRGARPVGERRRVAGTNTERERRKVDLAPLSLGWAAARGGIERPLRGARRSYTRRAELNFIRLMSDTFTGLLRLLACTTLPLPT